MSTPSQDTLPLRVLAPADPPKGIDAKVNTLHGVYHRRRAITKQIEAQADAICAMEAEHEVMSDGHLRNRLFELRSEIRRQRSLTDPDLLNPALAALREASRRQTGLFPFPVQIMGTLALVSGQLAEMATGEGKTLVAGLAGCLFGWIGHPCHVITVNDYLVKRDAERLGSFYAFAGIKVGTVTGQASPDERRIAYEADVTYTTAKEVLADYLRDRLRSGHIHDSSRTLIRQLVGVAAAPKSNLVLRGIHTAIIDEADSILIDEAVTPLIISAPKRNESLVKASHIAAEISSDFQLEADYTIESAYQEIRFLKPGEKKLAGLRNRFSGLWHSPARARELIQQALVAREFYRQGKQYIIEDGKIIIVDEFTGRPMPNRSWRQGIHQAVEAKEGLELSDPSETIARRSFQRFFRCYRHLCGMSGTAKESAGELWQTYALPTISIPTNKPCVRVHQRDRAFLTADEKWAAIVAEIRTCHASGQPILIGTRSVNASEHLASLLSEAGIHCQVLNAKRQAEEAAIVRYAGEVRRVTIATNMAGRGTDILLDDGAAALGGLHVIATERHESPRIDRQLFGRSARQGDPGSCIAFVSLEDELIQRHLPKAEKTALTALAKRLPTLARKLLPAAVRQAQKAAASRAVRQRQAVMRKDAQLESSLSFAGGD